MVNMELLAKACMLLVWGINKMESDINNRIKKAIKRVKKRPRIKNLGDLFGVFCVWKENEKMVDSMDSQ